MAPKKVFGVEEGGKGEIASRQKAGRSGGSSVMHLLCWVLPGRDLRATALGNGVQERGMEGVGDIGAPPLPSILSYLYSRARPVRGMGALPVSNTQRARSSRS